MKFFIALRAALKIRHLYFLPDQRAFYSTKLNVEQLTKRTILRISGPDTANYLQGMITNDVQNFEKNSCIYSLLLNFHGRVLYDILLYKIQDNEYLVEYDVNGKEHLKKHLLIYRLKKNVKIELVNSLSAWVIFQPLENNGNSNMDELNSLKSSMKDSEGFVTAAPDPRLPELGLRVVTKNECNPVSFIDKTSFDIHENNSYRLFRYQLGIGEGVLDHPPGSCFPFETNIDFLNGISFQKGCYIGQELTARVHYTGVVRKRLMPIRLEPMTTYAEFPPECPVLNDKGQKLGKFRCHLGEYGLAVLNHEECLKCDNLHIKDHNTKLKASKPRWWPQDVGLIKVDL